MPSARDERLRDRGEGDDRDRQGDVGDAGLERRVVQHLLHVQRQQEELREEGAATRSCVAFEVASVRRRKIRIGSSGACERSSIATKRGDQRGGHGQQSDRRRGAPAVLRRTGHRVDEQHQPARDRGGAGGVEVAVAEVGPALAHEQRGDDEEQYADGQVDEEDPRPAERARQHAAEQDAGRAAATRGGAPDAERDVPLAAFLERGGQDRERSR